MSDTLETVSDAQWAELAAESGMAPAELKARVAKYVETDGALKAEAPEDQSGPITSSGPCQITPFAAGIWKIIACKGEIRLCGPEDAWSGEVEITFLLADVPVKTVKYHLSKDKAEVSDSISLVAVRASYALGVKYDRWCFYIKGSFGYLTFTGWKDHKINKNLVCFGNI